jgi:hypothetical protein
MIIEKSSLESPTSPAEQSIQVPRIQIPVSNSEEFKNPMEVHLSPSPFEGTADQIKFKLTPPPSAISPDPLKLQIPILRKPTFGESPKHSTKSVGFQEISPRNAPSSNESLKYEIPSSPTDRRLSARPSQYLRLRRQAYETAQGTIHPWVEYSVLALIFLNVLAFLVGNVIIEGQFENGVCIVDCIDVHAKYLSAFQGFELFSVIIFTMEYTMRIWASYESPLYCSKGPFWGRISYALTFFCMVDLVSILPFWLNIAGFLKEVQFSLMLRGLTLVRFLKADRYIKAFALLGSVLYENGPLRTVYLIQ